MSDLAVIQASLVDVRNINTDKEIRLELRVPAEYAKAVVEAFGWPTKVDPVAVVVARLDEAAKPLPEGKQSREEPARTMPELALPEPQKEALRAEAKANAPAKPEVAAAHEQLDRDAIAKRAKPIEAPDMSEASCTLRQEGKAYPSTCPVCGLGPCREDVNKKRQFTTLPRSQQAGIRCNDPEFWKFLTEKADVLIDSAEEAAALVRHHCRINSRLQLDDEPAPAQRWDVLDAEFYAWQRGMR